MIRLLVTSPCPGNYVAMAFDVANPEAIAWARNQSATLVKAITEETRAAIRTLISEGISQKVTPRATARLLRAIIGLTDQGTRAVTRRYAELVGQGVSPWRATQRAEKYAAKLLRSRATTIARTETMRASNEGQQQLWQQALDKGFLPGSAKKAWIVADPCPKCAPLSGEQVPVNAEFSVGINPPLHPRCRCTMGLVL